MHTHISGLSSFFIYARHSSRIRVALITIYENYSIFYARVAQPGEPALDPWRRASSNSSSSSNGGGGGRA
jgi:hypothetical protein